MAQGSLLPLAKQLIPTNSWAPGVGYKFYTYAAGTLTPKATYQDSALSVANANPVIADARGEVVMYGSGVYRIIAKDASDVTIWDRDNVDTGGYAGTDTGTIFASQVNRVVDSISTLRALSKTAYTRAFVTGYYSAGDGGGGSYQVDPADVTTPDNGGTVIVAADGGRWNLQVTLAVSIKQFGARCDGSSVDTAAFESMVTYCAATGMGGFIPGTCLIDPSTRTFVGNLPFTIRGEGVSASTLRCTSPNSGTGFIYWTGANGAAFEDMTIDGSYTGSPSTPTSGGTLVFQNSSNNVLRRVDIQNIYRVACMIYNDHQTTTTNVYGGHVLDYVRALGPSNWVANVGPDAFILADVNNSAIKNCYANNIGRFGFELKNDSSNCLIADCVAEDTYYPLYFGGDGSHTELGYVKNSIMRDCVARRAQSGNAIHLTTASNNTIRNINMDQTGVAGGVQTVYITSSSNNNSLTGLDLKGRSTVALNIVGASSGNAIEFSNITDGAYTGKGTASSVAADCPDNTIIFGNRDSAHTLFLETYTFNNNTVIDRKTNRNFYSPAANSLLKHRFGDVGADNLPGSAAGLAVVANTANFYQTTAQTDAYQYFGNFTKFNIASVRYRLSDGTKFESLYNTGTVATATYLTGTSGFFPQEDNVRTLGTGSGRWSTVYAGTGTISTSDAREKQQIQDLSLAERSVAVRLKGLMKRFKFNDAVAEKGDAARLHVGVMAQDVQAAFAAEGLDGFQYAVLCFDEWQEQKEEIETWQEQQEVTDENGDIVQPYRAAGSRVIAPYRAPGNRYGVRYEELFAFIIAAL